MDFLSVITRVRNEPHLTEFVDYYLAEGADRIFVLDDGSDPPVPISISAHPKVSVHASHNFLRHQMWDTNLLYQEVRSQSEWFLVVDADEFVVPKKNPHSSLRTELETTFRMADCVKIPWVMMAANHRQDDPNSILEEVVHRWDHDRKHPHPTGWRKGRCRYDAIEVKSAFRAAAFDQLKNCHHPHAPATPVRVVESVHCLPSPLNSFYTNLREADIAQAHLVCFHYRFPSTQSCVRKISDSHLPRYATQLSDLLAADYPEIVDTTMQDRVRGRARLPRGNTQPATPASGGKSVSD